MGQARKHLLILVDQIEPRILLIRGQRAILDADLAELYGTTTKRLNEQVKRNLDRFPSDFMFRLTSAEARAMRSQSVTASGPFNQCGRKLRPHPSGISASYPMPLPSTGP
jgi:hypothetical protein